MKYMLLIHQGDTPTPRDPDSWAKLSEDEQKAVYADYQAINGTPGVTPGIGPPGPRDGDDGARRRRADARHRRAVRVGEGGARRLARVRGGRPRRRDRASGSRAGGAARRRGRDPARRTSGSGTRADLPGRVGPCRRGTRGLPRRFRSCRGSRAGSLCRGCGALGSRRRAGQPACLARGDGKEPGDRPHPPRPRVRGEGAAPRRSGGHGGPGGARHRTLDDGSIATSGSSSSSPAAIRRSRWRRRWR